MNDEPFELPVYDGRYPPWVSYYPRYGLWWDARLRRWFTHTWEPVEIVMCDGVVPEPTEDVLDRIHLDWTIGAAIQQHGERQCQSAMEELIIESLDNDPPHTPVV